MLGREKRDKKRGGHLQAAASRAPFATHAYQC